MICGLCRLDVDKFVESHIIPKAILIDGLKDGEKIAIAGTVGYPKRSPTGMWSKIVCSDCEKSFGKDDEYLIAFYRQIDQFPIAFEGHATLLDGVDPARLQRSILSVFFRAHLSDHITFRSVDLGPNAESLRQFIRSTTTETPPSFSVWLRHLQAPLGEIVIQPIHEEFDGINAYRFFMPKITAVIRVDTNEFPEPFRSLNLGATQQAYALRTENHTPSETRIIRRIFEINREKLPGALGIKNRT